MVHPKCLGHVIIESATTTSSDIEPVRILKEERSSRIGGKRVIAQTVFQEANVKNRNQRFYSSEELFPQLSAPRTLELLKAKQLLAEAGHPMSKDLVRQQTIDPKNTIANILEFWTDGNFVKGKFKPTNNALGDTLNQDLLDGCSPAWSLRALGRVEQTARGAEVKNLKLITYDYVIFPSHPTAYTEGIVSESASMLSEDMVVGNKLYLKENDSGMLIPITNDQVIDYVKSESANIRTLKESLDLFYTDIALIENATKVQLTDKEGGIFIINLESYIHDEIMNEVLRRR